MLRLAGDLASAFFSYAKIGWWGLVSPRVEGEPLVVVQGVIEGEGGILLAVRSDLRGWELPGGTVEAGESPEETLRREVGEETGLEIEVGSHVGDYVRTGFRPHTAKVYRARVTGGTPKTNWETRTMGYFDSEALPSTLFPWYVQPIEDAFGDGESLTRHDHQDIGTILAAIQIDLRMRTSRDEAP